MADKKYHKSLEKVWLFAPSIASVNYETFFAKLLALYETSLWFRLIKIHCFALAWLMVQDGELNGEKLKMPVVN